MALTYSNGNWNYTPAQLDTSADLPISRTVYVKTVNGINWATQSSTIDVTGEPKDGYTAVTIDYLTPDWTFGLYWRPRVAELKDPLVKGKAANDEKVAYNTRINKKNVFESNIYTIVIPGVKNNYFKYLKAKDLILNYSTYLAPPNYYTAGYSNTEIQTIVDSVLGYGGSFRNYYLAERVTPWDPSVLPATLSNTIKARNDLGANFNKYANGATGYYTNETSWGRSAKAEWDSAVKNDDLDILGRYKNLNDYALQNYITQITDPTRSAASIAAIRGSEAKSYHPFVSEYQEQAFPDAIAQQTRDEVQNKIFGLTPTSSGYVFTDVTKGISNLISTNTTFSNLWTKAKADITLSQNISTPWSKLLTSLGVNDNMVTDQNSFASLLGLVANLNPNDADDKKIIDNNADLYKQISALKSDPTFNNLISYSPQINDAFTASVQQSEADNTKKFADLRQSVLQDTINELIRAKKQELNYSFFANSSVGQEITSLQQDITGSLLGDVGVGGVSPFVQNPQTLQSKLDLGLGNIFGTKNGLIYNWEDWFNKQIEKKYAGNVDIPDDYVPPSLRTISNGFVDAATADSWKKYDTAYATLKINPNDIFSKNIVNSAPLDYVPVENRKTVQPSWTTYEAQLKAAGYIDLATLDSWKPYDDAYKTISAPDANTAANSVKTQAAKTVYAKRPADYIPPDKRLSDTAIKDALFIKDFFTTYLKPRFDASQSIAEFKDYIDITNDTQNPFQTQDRLNALKLAAQSSVSQWFTNLQKAAANKFNPDYYVDPITYLKTNGIQDSATGNVFLSNSLFSSYVNTTLSDQGKRVTADWEAAKAGKITKDDQGNDINWAQQAYIYGADIKDKAQFAKLHFQLVGMNATNRYDGAPDIYAPQISKMYITQVLTPMLIDKANKIGTVFGQFVKPKDYVNELLKVLSLPENKDQWNNILKSYGIDPNESLNEISDTLVNALSQDSTLEIKKKIGDAITQGKVPTQADLGVEYIQRAKPTYSGVISPPSGVYAIFKNAGFNGTEDQFYSTFMPDASAEDIQLLNASYTTSGKALQLFPTITGSGIEQIASMAALFGDTNIQEVLSTAGIPTPSGQIGGLAQTLFSTSGEDVGIGDPFADTTYTLTSTGLAKTTTSGNKIGIGNPFDDIGISDPFADSSDPFLSSSNAFSSIGSSSSVGKLKIQSGGNAFTKGFSPSSSSVFSSDLFSSFGGSFGF